MAELSEQRSSNWSDGRFPRDEPPAQNAARPDGRRCPVTGGILAMPSTALIALAATLRTSPSGS